MSTDLGAVRAADNPYVGPQSFRRGDAFYGRDRETGDLLDLLIAERVMLLYSPSGAGKSSLIAAGLVPQLEAENFEVLPIVRLTHEVPPGSLSGPPRNRYVLSTLLSLEEGLPRERQRRVDELDAMTVTQYLAAWPDLDGRPGNEVLLFDQFEEVITADPVDHDTKKDFFADIGNALRDRSLWALFSIREDFLAELDPYARLVPTLFANRFRLNLLTVDQALEATIRPAADRGVEFMQPAAMKLVDDLRMVRVQRPDGVTEEGGPTVEPVQLQVACRQVWNRLPEGARTIGVDDVEAVGTVDQALANYYADCVASAAAETGVSERALRDWFENELVTPQGIRGQVLSGPRQNGAFSERAVRMLTDAHLVRAESRRGATWYELAHDRLIGPVKADNARWRERNLSYVERLAAWWDKNKRPDQALLSGDDLVAAEQWVTANPTTVSSVEQEFLDASQKADELAERDRRATKRTRRWLVIALVGCLVAVAALIGTAAALKNSADAERETAQLASELEASKLALQASMAGDFDVDLGLLLAQRAAALPGGSGDNTDIRNALQTAVDKSPVVAVLRGHGPATDAVYSDDGEFIATHHDDGSVVVWNAVSNQELYQLAGVADGLAMDRKTLDFDPSGTKLAGITSDGSVAIWSLPPAEGDPVLVDPNPGGTWHLAFSPDGTRIAAAGTPGVVVIDSAGRPTSDFGTPVSEEVDGYEVEWTPDGEQLVVAGADGVVSALDSESGEYLRDILSYPSAALTLDISAAGPTIASSTRDVVVVTDFETGAEIYRLENQATVDVSFSTDASRLIVMDGYGTAAVVAPSAEVVKQWVSASGMSPLAVDVDPTNPGRAVVAGAAGAPAVWNVSAGHSDAESAIESLPDGGVVTASYDGSVYAWRPDLTPRAVVPASDDPIQDASVDAAGELVALARSSGAVEVWSLQTGGRVFSDSMGEGVSAFAVALSPDGQYVAGGDDTGQVLVWEVATGAEYADLDSHTDAVVSLEYGADQQQLVSASWDERAIVWDLDNGTPALDIALETGATVVAWNSPGTVIAVGGDDGSVQFFDASSGDRLQMGIEHVEPVTDLAFDASGERLVSGSDDHSVIIWDATTGSMLERVQRGDSPWRVAFSVDGRHVLVGDGSGVPNVVFLDIDQLLRVAEQRATREITTQECEFYLGNAECGTGTAV